MTNAEVIETAGSGIAAYSEFRAQLAQLEAENRALVFDYADPKGQKDARSHIHKLRRTKGAVESARKTEKAASLEYGRRVDAEAKEIIEQIETMIDVHERPIREIEEREEARKQELAAKLGALCAYRETPASRTAVELRERLAELQAIVIDESYAESMAAATTHKKDAAAHLAALIADTERREAEAAELARLRAEEAARAQAEREQRIAAEAAAKAKADAEAAAERAARQEREAAEARERAEKERADRAEREAKAAEERAAKAAQEAVERERREAEQRAKAEADAAAKREADKVHRAKVNNAAADALVEAGITKEQAQAIVTLIAQRKVPAVTISY